MAQIREREFIDEEYVPPPAAVEAKAADLGVGLDTAAVVTRREAIKVKRDAVAAKITAYAARTAPARDNDVALILTGLLATLDAAIAAGFDA